MLVVGSILSDLSYSRSDDDLDMESVMRKRRSFRKIRPSQGSEEMPSAKRRRSQLIEVELTVENLKVILYQWFPKGGPRTSVEGSVR
jgi:hypothetical protein